MGDYEKKAETPQTPPQWGPLPSTDKPMPEPAKPAEKPSERR